MFIKFRERSEMFAKKRVEIKIFSSGFVGTTVKFMI